MYQSFKGWRWRSVSPTYHDVSPIYHDPNFIRRRITSIFYVRDWFHDEEESILYLISSSHKSSWSNFSIHELLTFVVSKDSYNSWSYFFFHHITLILYLSSVLDIDITYKKSDGLFWYKDAQRSTIIDSILVKYASLVKFILFSIWW